MNYLIFGGGGFIGTHLAKYIAEQRGNIENIYNLDINNKTNDYSKYINLDVRQLVNVEIAKISSSIIFNLAAVHVTPGHNDNEYFEANIFGAENICNFARKNEITTIVFTSSIAPYGVSENIKTEETLPMPNSPYGISKLTAEYIHKVWQAEAPDKRKLIIVRPGVVFGKNEGGNFTRLYKSLKQGFFFYAGRKDTIKAAVYVKDVARILYETSIYEDAGVITLNLTYFPAPTIEKICEAITNVTKIKKPKIVLQSGLLKLAAGVLYSTAKMFGKKINGIHPDRVKKLMISTNISGERLDNSRYRLRYNLEEAITDWFNDCEKRELG
ncbi:MAG: NAD(P)-dependent oxidoreductase [Mucilaginibacter sp.]|nr:NAD(P)-dependent oxidoreductase [Mucilaginibacter sp.]